MGGPSRAATPLGPGTPLETRPLALLVLHAFAEPRSVEDALDSVAAAGMQDWIDLSSTVFGLARARVLVAMLNDVLDIGTGSGIFATTAALAAPPVCTRSRPRQPALARAR